MDVFANVGMGSNPRECRHSYLSGVTWQNGYAYWVPFALPWQAEPGNSLPDYLPARDMNLHSTE